MKYFLFEILDFIYGGFFVGLGFWLSCYLVLLVTGWIESWFNPKEVKDNEI